MASATLLIPGTQATCLQDANGVIVYNAVRVSLGLQRDDLGGRPPAEWTSLLSVEHAPDQWAPVRTSLAPNTRLSAGAVVDTPYARMKTFVQDFAYDWRGDLRFNAKRLLQFLTDNRPPGGGRWNLIGHSQGGLIIVLASKLAVRADDFARLVARVVLVGAPLAGTMRAAEALLTGRDDLGPGMKEAARDMARTWPALYQMLPSWKAVLGTDGNPLPANQQLTEIGGWPSQVGIQPDLLLRARQTQTLLTGPFSYFGPGIATLVILGDQQDTPVTLVRSGDVFPPNTTRNETGDTLVPCQRTLDWGGTHYSDTALLLDGDVKTHAMLCTDEDVLSAIREFLNAPAPPSPVGP
jgi:pimeloyl-ACP methyl ester carboxylesterase